MCVKLKITIYILFMSLYLHDKISEKTTESISIYKDVVAISSGLIIFLLTGSIYINLT